MSPIHWSQRSLLRAGQNSCWTAFTPPVLHWRQPRCALRTSLSPNPPSIVPDFAFAFDIDGVLLRGKKALPRASKTLAYLRTQNIPFVLLTNGGGVHEKKRATHLSQELDAQIRTSMVLQSHTPFSEMENFKDKTVLVVGGHQDWCRRVAEKYGFKTVVTPGDIWTQHPEIWPFSKAFEYYHKGMSHAQPLPKPIDPSNPAESLKIDAIFVYNDPRDWGLDATIILDCLLSREGILGTLSSKNNNPQLPNRGYQQDKQPPLFFSNPDLWWAADFALPRLGQGGFQAALDGLWAATTGGPAMGAVLRKTISGKPYKKTYEFAEKRLNLHRNELFGDSPHRPLKPLKKVYMVGDNPESDIRGANDYKSPFGTHWSSILLKTGVYDGGTPAVQPTVIQEDVYDAVKWAVGDSEWEDIS